MPNWCGALYMPLHCGATIMLDIWIKTTASAIDTHARISMSSHTFIRPSAHLGCTAELLLYGEIYRRLFQSGCRFSRRPKLHMRAHFRAAICSIILHYYYNVANVRWAVWSAACRSETSGGCTLGCAEHLSGANKSTMRRAFEWEPIIAGRWRDETVTTKRYFV